MADNSRSLRQSGGQKYAPPFGVGSAYVRAISKVLPCTYILLAQITLIALIDSILCSSVIYSFAF